MTTMAREGTVERQTSPWPRYDAAETGLRNYWYPVTWSSRVGKKPFSFRLLDEPIFLLRANGRLHALHDQCPHRGIPLSVGRCEFPGTWSCRYHGWTFDLETGVLKAALTDGVDSPICGRSRVRTYPVEERAGIIWVYIGDIPPPPVEEDIPSEFLRPDAVVLGRISTQRGNWRWAAEGGADAGHAFYLHRYGVILNLFERLPSYVQIKMVDQGEGWIGSQVLAVGRGDDYPGLGHWPRDPFWKRPR